MSDGAIIALIGFVTVLAAGAPAVVTAVLSRQTRNHVAETKATLGEKNGNGDAMQMLARSLGQNAEILKWQEEHSELDDVRLGDMLNRIVELSQYSHDGVHSIRNLLTPLNGKIDLMWKDYLAQHEPAEDETTA